MLMFENKSCLGVDISGRDIKIVELRHTRDGYEVMQASRVEIGGGDVASALKQFIAETDTRHSTTVWSLPSNACSVKFARLPKTHPSETAKMVRYEAESQIPLPLADLIWGYSASKSARGDDLKHVVIAGIRRSVADETNTLLEAAGLPLHAALVASLAEVLAIRKTVRDFDESICIVDIGEEWTDITIVDNGEVSSCRSIRHGIAGLQCAASEELDIDIEEACNLIRRQSILEDTSFPTKGGLAVLQWVDRLASEISRSALASTSSSQSKTTRTVVLAGDGAGVAGLADALALRTGLPTEIGDPWSGMTLCTVAARNKRDIPAVFAVATGLAIAGLKRDSIINLMPRERAEEATRRRKEMMLLTALGIVPVALLAVLLTGQSVIGAKSAELEALRIQTIAAKTKSPMTVPAEIRQTTTLMGKIVRDLQDKKGSPIEILRLLSESIPKSCWLTEFRFESGKSVVLRGNALSNSAIADTFYLLSDTAGFQSVSLDYSNLGKSATSPIYDFQIKCVLPANTSRIGKGGWSKGKITKERQVVR